MTAKLLEEIISYCKEQDPLYLVLGRPEEEGEDNLLSRERLQLFADGRAIEFPMVISCIRVFLLC